MTPSKTAPYYRPTGAAMWRASVHGPDLDLPAWPGQADEAGPWCAWLAKVWTHRPLAEAVALASPVLADRIEQILAGRPVETAQVRRMAMSLARYLVRLRGRATPFGTFAGVGSAAFGPVAELTWSDDHRVRTRADAVWLAAVIARLERCPPLLRRLPVVVNDLALERAGRLVVPWQPHLSAPAHGQDSTESSVRLVPVVRTIQHAARWPIVVGDLIDKVMAEYPGAAREALDAAVGDLVSSGVLISSLRAPSTVTDPLAHLLAHLQDADAAGLSEIRPLLDELRAISEEMTGLDAAGTWGHTRDRRVTVGRMRALSAAVDQPLAADLRLGGTLVLPHTVADEASLAAEALIRLTPELAVDSWRNYHCRFLDRYGAGTLIPLADLVDAVTGLGFPAHFTRPPGAREVAARDEALLAMAQQAVLDGADEVVLDAAALDALAPAHQAVRRPVTAADVWADLRAASTGALERGDFTLGVSGFGRAAATTGRFLDLLEPKDQRRAAGLYASLPPGVDGALAAQLSFPSRHPRSENVLRVPPVLPYVVPLAEHRVPSDAHIAAGDLAVVADATGLYVVSRSRRRVVEAMLPNAGARHTMPPLARLLFEIPRSAHPAVTGFDWGIASCLPYRPRVRHGRTILAPAQWRLGPADLPGPDAPTDAWDMAFDDLRERRGLPEVVAVGAGDRRMRLNLDEHMDRAVLRAHLEAVDGPVTLAEGPAAAEYGWVGGRAHEIVIPLVATAPPTPAPAVLSTSAPLPVAAPTDGSGVVYVKLHAPSEAFDAILTRQVPDLLAQWDKPLQWWFVRYRHPTEHLRLRFHDPHHERAAGRIAAWANGLRQRGMAGEIVFDSYRPQTGRYGPGQAMEAAESLFAADSATALAQLSFLATHRDIAPQALVAASLLDLAGAVLGGPSTGADWVIAHREYADGAPAQDRAVYRQALRLTDTEVLPDLPGGAEVAAAWAARAQAAATYTARLTPAITRLAPETVLGSLMHLHHVRVLGIDPQSEAITYKLARAVALARTARSQRGEQR
ncbi:lantibiotic dehydratase [Streptomyces sp. NPDC002659]|uniref:lantibiotic dehydratase n=1 Tax=Streptomyces sp. NPDC002659 TaxID=3364656 RepID=UPI0036C6E2AD